MENTYRTMVGESGYHLYDNYRNAQDLLSELCQDFSNDHDGCRGTFQGMRLSFIPPQGEGIPQLFIIDGYNREILKKLMRELKKKRINVNYMAVPKSFHVGEVGKGLIKGAISATLIGILGTLSATDSNLSHLEKTSSKLTDSPNSSQHPPSENKINP